MTIEEENEQLKAEVVKLKATNRILELRAANAPRGTIRNVVLSPPGAVYAEECRKNDEANKRNKDYIPSWNPGKVVR